MTLVLFWLVCGIAASAVASAKGRSGIGWLLLGVLLGPLALLAAAVIGRDTERDIRDGLRFGDLRPCPERQSPLERLFVKIADKLGERDEGPPTR